MKLSDNALKKQSSIILALKEPTRNSLAPLYSLFGHKITRNGAYDQNITWTNDLKYLPNVLHSFLFEIWKEEDDPSLQYYPTLYSHTDFQLLASFIKHKKLVGIILISNIINIVNLLSPDFMIWTDSASAVNLQDGIENAKTSNNFIYYFLGYGRYGYCMSEMMVTFLIDLFIQAFYFCISIYSVLNPSLDLNQSKCKVLIGGGVVLQYVMAAAAISYPGQFFFQFFVNQTILLLLIIKEVSSTSKQMIMLCASTLFANYLVLSGFRYNPDQAFQRLAMVNDAVMYKTYILGMIIILTSQYQCFAINRNLACMLVEKINLLQHNLGVKETYNASMIHELRNPLSAVIGSISLLKYSKSISKEDIETLNIASVSSDFLITLINNALDGAKLEANKLELDSRMNDIVEVLTKSVSLYQWKAKEKKVKISLLVGKMIPDQVDIDDARFTQILVNIIGNAVKFTPENGSVKVRAKFVQDDGYSDLGLSGIDRSYPRRYDQGSEFQEDFEEDEEYEKQNFLDKKIGLDALTYNEEIADLRGGGGGPRRFNEHDMSGLQFDDESNNDDRSVGQVSGKYGIAKRGESQTSLCNISSLDEQNMHARIPNLDMDIRIKNSFGEWSPLKSDITRIDRAIKNVFRDSFSIMKDAQHIPSIQLIKELSSEKSLLQSEHNKQNTSYSRSSAYRRFYQGPRDSENFSDSIPRDNSLSMDSFIGGGDRGNSRTYTNSSGSNQMIFQKRSKTKSKFYKEENSDESDESSKERSKTQKDRYLNISEQGPDYLLNQNQLDISKEKRSQETRGTLIIEIIDSGIGMTPEGISKLFKPFSQADKSIQAKYGGTGLGLWITNKLVGIMKGSIKVKSEVNKGTSFIISIPVQAEFNPIFQSEMRHSNRIDTPTSSKHRDDHHRIATFDTLGTPSTIKVLLFQKDEIFKKFSKRQLKDLNIESMITSNFKEFLKAFKTKKYKACFIDIEEKVKMEDLEKLVSLRHDFNNSLQHNEPKIKLYCLYSHDIEKQKNQFLRKNKISKIKKPLSMDHLTEILNKFKDKNFYDPQQQNQRNQSQEQELSRIAIDSQRFKAPSMNAIPFGRPYNPRITIREINNQSFSDGLVVSEQIQRMSLQNQMKHNSNFNTGDQHARNPTGDHMMRATLKFGSQEEFRTSNRQSQQSLDSPGRKVSEIQPHNSRLSLMLQAKCQDNVKFKASDRIDTPPSHQRKLDSLDEIFTEEFKSSSYNMRSTKKNNLNNSMNMQQKSHFEDEEEKNSNQTQQTANFNSSSRITNHNINSTAENNLYNRSTSNEKLENSSRFNQDNKKIQLISINEIQAAQDLSFHKPINPIFSAMNSPTSNKISHGPLNNSVSNSNSMNFTSSNLAVLVVDDAQMNQIIAQKMLEKLPAVNKNKVKILLANNGQEAFQVFQSQEIMKNGKPYNKIKLILMDCEMPVLDGYEATQKIRDYERTNYSGTQSKVLITGLSGNEGDQHSRKCRQAGMNEAVTKPIMFDQLKQLVSKAILPYTKSKFSPNVTD